jgi:hypothetical protein
MSLTLRLKDSNGRMLQFDEEGSIRAVVHPHPPLDETVVSAPFRQYFTNDGTSSGSNDMLVNGSSTAQEFYIKASSTQDIYINRVSVLIADAGAALNQLGSITALSNGILFQWQNDVLGDTVIHEGLKTNFDFIQLSGGKPAFRASNVSESSDAFIPVIDIDEIFGIPYGLKLRKSSNDRLVMRIRDNVSTLDELNMIAYGIRL